MVLKAENLKYSYSSKVLIDDISFAIEDHDKIGLIGVNGSGKSTLLSILATIKEPEKGNVEIIGKKTISYMLQEIDLNNDITIAEYITNTISDSDIAIYQAKAILTKLEITDFHQKINILSGGTKRKLALGVALAKPSDLLILDEPTNHLDSDIIEWLEKHLIRFNKALLMVTHDRYFLERVCNKIVELDNGKLYCYEANYSKYLELKAERTEYELAANRKLQSFLRKEYEWIKRGPQARATKDKKRIQNYEELTSTPQTVEKSLVIDSVKSRLGNKTIELVDVSKSFNEQLFSDISFNLNKNERIGIIGKNGTGKTTLLDIIASVTAPSTGEVIIGETIKIGYFKQENIDLNYDLRLIEYIKEIASFVQTKNGVISASQMLERFLFFDPHVYVGKLSGGEKRRLYLLGILMMAPNVLLLDEPTNDLDITTLGILESYLDDFSGIVMVVSHDRYFLDRVCEKLFVLENKRLQIYNGSYSDYIKNRKDVNNKKLSSNLNSKTEETKESDNKVIKLTFKEEKELTSIVDEIEELENELKSIESDINKYYADYDKCRALYSRQEEVQNLLDQKMDRWEYLNIIYENSKKRVN